MKKTKIKCSVCNSANTNSWIRDNGDVGFVCLKCMKTWSVSASSYRARVQPPKSRIRRRFIGPQPPLTPGIPTGH